MTNISVFGGKRIVLSILNQSFKGETNQECIYEDKIVK